jgi:ankyrin repeat protein
VESLADNLGGVQVCTGLKNKAIHIGSLTAKHIAVVLSTPWLEAKVCCRHPATATFLMTMGSNPCVADREGAKMAIHYACLYGHWACTQVMMEPRWVVQNGGGLKPLAQAIITDMHGQNRYIDARTCAGLTPLHMAAWAGHVEVAKILLQNGAYLNPKIVFSSPSTSSVLPGSTPTHLATRKNRIHVVKALLTSYVRINLFLCAAPLKEDCKECVRHVMIQICSFLLV